MVEGGDPASVFFRDVTGPRGGPRQREGDSPSLAVATRAPRQVIYGAGQGARAGGQEPGER